MAGYVTIMLLWDVTRYTLVDRHQCFGEGADCSNVRVTASSPSNYETAGNWNIGMNLLSYTVPKNPVFLRDTVRSARYSPLLENLQVHRVSHEERTKLREIVPYVKLYRYNPKHLYPKLNGYGDNGHRKVWASVVSTYCKQSVTSYSSTAQARERKTTS